MIPNLKDVSRKRYSRIPLSIACLLNYPLLKPTRKEPDPVSGRAELRRYRTSTFHQSLNAATIRKPKNSLRNRPDPNSIFLKVFVPPRACASRAPRYQTKRIFHFNCTYVFRSEALFGNRVRDVYTKHESHTSWASALHF